MALTPMQERIRSTHAKRCPTWETWTSVERDQNRRQFTAIWEGCRECGVNVLINTLPPVEAN